MNDVKYIERVSIGSVDPNTILSDEKRDEQLTHLNRCLQEFPRGKIIGKDVTIGTFKIGDHQLVTEKTTYHIGFTRRPIWLDDKK